MPFILEERGLKRHFQQTSLVVVVRGKECCHDSVQALVKLPSLLSSGLLSLAVVPIAKTLISAVLFVPQLGSSFSDGSDNLHHRKSFIFTPAVLLPFYAGALFSIDFLTNPCLDSVSRNSRISSRVAFLVDPRLGTSCLCLVSRS
ncbi:hypothetical protein Tco_0115930 [Tanacetum coccineum]